MEEASMVNIALIGVGRWGSRLVAAAAASGDKVKFTAAASRDATSHADWAAAHGLVPMDFDAVLSEPSIDAVLIATPHDQHAREVVAAASAGKHVFVEKPLALTRSDAERAVAASVDAGVVLAHGFNRRFAPAFRDLARRVRDGELGEILHLEGQFSGPSGFALKPGMWRSEPAQCPAGAMTARGIHALDCMISLAGPVRSVFARSTNRVIPVPVDDVTSAMLAFDNEVTGTIASHHATAEIWRVQVYGSMGWIEMRSETELILAPVGGEPSVIHLDAIDQERAELEAFADAISGLAPYPVTAAEAVNGVAVVEAMAASAETRNEVAIG